MEQNRLSTGCVVDKDRVGRRGFLGVSGDASDRPRTSGYLQSRREGGCTLDLFLPVGAPWRMFVVKATSVTGRPLSVK